MLPKTCLFTLFFLLVYEKETAKICAYVYYVCVCGCVCMIAVHHTVIFVVDHIHL